VFREVIAFSGHHLVALLPLWNLSINLLRKDFLITLNRILLHFPVWGGKITKFHGRKWGKVRAVYASSKN